MTALEPFSAIGGTSILGDFRAAAEGDESLSYFQYAGFVELAEALVFHDRIVLVGTPEDTAYEQFIDRLNDACKAYVVNTLNDTDFAHFIDRPEIQRRLHDVLDHCFGRDAIPVSPKLLNRRPGFSRLTDDYKREIIDAFRVSALAVSEGQAKIDAPGFAELLKNELTNSYRESHKQFTINYLFRGFLHAAIALEYRGSLLADGVRRITRSVVVSSYPTVPVTLPKRLYDLANAAYRIAAWPQITTYPYVPIAIQHLVNKLSTRSDIISRLADMRTQFTPFRSIMNEHHALLSDPSTPARELAQARATLISATERYIAQLMSTFSLDSASQSGVLKKFAQKSIDSLAGIPKLKTGDHSEFETEVGGQLLLQLVRVGYQTYSDQKQENRLAPLLALIDETAAQRGVVARISDLLPVRPFDWAPFDETFYQSYTVG